MLDKPEIKNKVMAHLRSHPDTDAILTLGPTSAHPTLSALDDMGRSGDMYFGTFDLSGEIAAAVKSGVISFAIDQQPYLQGYLPVVFLTNMSRYGVWPSGAINSGPGFITKSNISLVEQYAGVYR